MSNSNQMLFLRKEMVTCWILLTSCTRLPASSKGKACVEIPGLCAEIPEPIFTPLSLCGLFPAALFASRPMPLQVLVLEPGATFSDGA